MTVVGRRALRREVRGSNGPAATRRKLALWDGRGTIKSNGHTGPAGSIEGRNTDLAHTATTWAEAIANGNVMGNRTSYAAQSNRGRGARRELCSSVKKRRNARQYCHGKHGGETHLMMGHVWPFDKTFLEHGRTVSSPQRYRRNGVGGDSHVIPERRANHSHNYRGGDR